MKQKLALMAVFLLLLGGTATAAFADNGTAVALAAQQPADSTTSTFGNDPTAVSLDTSSKETLADKKAGVQAQLSGILDKLTDLAGQTQTAVSALAVNNIDVTAPQTLLTDAQTNITASQVNLAALTAITVTSPLPKAKTATTLKNIQTSVLKLETTLQIARTDLIQALTTLQTSITAQTISSPTVTQ